MLGFGRKKLDLENFSHFSLNSFHFVLSILFYLHKKKLKWIQIMFFSLFRRSEVKIGVELSSKYYKSQAELSLELLSFL